MPSTVSAIATARVISRLLRDAGFQMADTSNRHRWTEGFYVHRVGCSDLVSVDYHLDLRAKLDVQTGREKRRLERSRARQFLTEKGYVFDPAHESAMYIQCERP